MGQEQDLTKKNRRKEAVTASQGLWEKARVNAFAHKVARDRNFRIANIMTMLSIVFGIFSIVAVLFTYLVLQFDPASGDFQKNKDGITYLISIFFDLESQTTSAQTIKSFLALTLTLVSIICSVLSLLTTIYSAIKNFSSLANEHEILQSFCLDIAQKIRPLRENRSNITQSNFDSSLIILEEQFRLIKMRGLEPSDKDFNKAHRILRDRYLSKKKINLLSASFRKAFFKNVD